MADRAAQNRRYREAVWTDLRERLGGKCIDCGIIDDLEVDHVIASEKAFDLKSRWTRNPSKRLLDEAAKCVLRCHPCHVKKSRASGDLDHSKGWAHGSVYGWMKKKCGCESCAAARDAFNAQRREQRAQSQSGARGPYSKDPQHGTTARYHRGCKCHECRAANTVYQRSWRNR